MQSLMERFEKSFLTEFPMNIGYGYGKALEILKNSISELQDYGATISNLGSLNTFEIFKLDSINNVYYWFETNSNMILACELEKVSDAMIVRLLGKDSTFSHKTPFAYELFEIILQDLHQNIRLLSDQSMTIDGFNNWLKLFDAGYKVSIYNRNNVGSFKILRTKKDMEEFFQKGPQYKDYQFILSETAEQIGTLISQFGIQNYRELSGVKSYKDWEGE